MGLGVEELAQESIEGVVMGEPCFMRCALKGACLGGSGHEKTATRPAWNAGGTTAQWVLLAMT